MRPFQTIGLFGAVMLLGSSSALAGGANDIDLGAYTGLIFPGPNHELYDPQNSLHRKLTTGPALGARASYRPLSFLAGEVELHGAAAGTEDAGGALLYALRAHAMGILPVEDLPGGFEPFLLAGFGNMGVSSSDDVLGNDLDVAMHTGVGARLPISKTLSLRGDLRYLLTAKHTVVSSPGGHTEFFLGINYRMTPEADKDGDGMVDNRDTCPDEAETVNDWRDDDGCPDVLAQLTVHIDDTEGLPVEDIIVLADGKELGRTNVNGDLVIDGLPPESTVVVSGAHFHMEASPTSEVSLSDGPNETSLEMQWLPGRVRVVTKGQDGPIADAVASFTGPKEVDTAPVEDGDEVFFLAPGDWMILVSADSFGTERRELSIAPDQTSLVVIEVELEPAKVEVTREEVVILEKILFASDRAVVESDSFDLLEEVSSTLLANPQITLVELQGHTDSQGPASTNKRLSQARVDAVQAWLVNRGVAVEILTAVGYGEDQPIADNDTVEGRAENRRVQFVILEQAE